MRHPALSLVAGFVTLAAAFVFLPQEAEARDGFRGYRGGYGSHAGQRGYGYRRSYARPYSTNYRPYYRPYRYDVYNGYGGVYNGYGGYNRYPSTPVYIPPTIGPSPYGYRGMIGPRPVVSNPGIYYRF
jgi:hypothetical protein